MPCGICLFMNQEKANKIFTLDFANRSGSMHNAVERNPIDIGIIRLYFSASPNNHERVITMIREIKSKRLRQKNYFLVNSKTGEAVVVHPPSLPGVNADGHNPKENGKWIRKFQVVDANGVAKFKKMKEIILLNTPSRLPSVKLDGERWSVKVIPVQELVEV